MLPLFDNLWPFANDAAVRRHKSGHQPATLNYVILSATLIKI